MYHIVYKTTNTINGKIYIGKHSTNNLYDGYLGSGKLLKEDIKVYGRNTFVREILSTHDTSEGAFNDEILRVDVDFVNREDTYNLVCGGGNKNGVGVSVSEETKQQISKSLSGFKHSTIAKQHMRESHIGFKHTTESKQKMSIASKGKKLSKEHKQALSKSRKGNILTEEHKEKLRDHTPHNKGIPMDNSMKKRISNTLKGRIVPRDVVKKRCKPVIQSSLDGEFIKEWKSIKDAQDTLHISGISSCCSGKLKTVGKYKWAYKKGCTHE